MDNPNYSLPSEASIHLDINMATRTSARSQATAEFLSAPWRFATRQTYDKDTNPDGVISFALAENVRESPHQLDFGKKKTQKLTKCFHVEISRPRCTRLCQSQCKSRHPSICRCVLRPR